MVNIKRFIDRVSNLDTQVRKDLIMPATEARALRDEIVKLLADRVEQNLNSQEVIEVQMIGDKF